MSSGLQYIFRMKLLFYVMFMYMYTTRHKSPDDDERNDFHFGIYVIVCFEVEMGKLFWVLKWLWDFVARILVTGNLCDDK